MSDPSAVKSFFDVRASRYAADFFDAGEVPAVYPLGLRRLEGTLEALGNHVPAGGLVIDLGCGVGQATLGAAKAGFRGQGFDISSGMIEEAEKLRALQTAEVREKSAFWCCDLFETGLAAGSADAVVALGVLEYLPDDKPFLGEAARLLRSGGLMVLEVRNRFFNLLSANRFTAEEAASPAFATVVARLAPRLATPLSLESRREFARRLRAAADAFDRAITADEAEREEAPPSFGGARRQHDIDTLTAEAGEAGFAWVAAKGLHPHPLPPAVEKSSPAFYNQLAALFDALAAEPAALAWSSSALVVYRKR